MAMARAYRPFFQTLSTCFIIPTTPRSLLFSCSSPPAPASSRPHTSSSVGEFRWPPWLLSRVQPFSIRRKTSRRQPYCWVNMGDHKECPSSQPNKGSVKNRKQKKRMAQRDAFRKEQVQAQIRSCKAAKKRKEEARRKRWKEAAARARAWAERQAQKLAEAQENLSSPA